MEDERVISIKRCERKVQFTLLKHGKVIQRTVVYPPGTVQNPSDPSPKPRITRHG